MKKILLESKYKHFNSNNLPQLRIVTCCKHLKIIYSSEIMTCWGILSPFIIFHRLHISVGWLGGGGTASHHGKHSWLLIKILWPTTAVTFVNATSLHFIDQIWNDGETYITCYIFVSPFHRHWFHWTAVWLQLHVSLVHVSACSFAVSQASDLALLVGYVA